MPKYVSPPVYRVEGPKLAGFENTNRLPPEKQYLKDLDLAIVKMSEKSLVEGILAERGKRYGDFFSHSIITQNIKTAMKDSPNWITLEDDQRETLEMVAHKIGRILNGDPNYLDSWDDIVGYVTLVTERLRGK